MRFLAKQVVVGSDGDGFGDGGGDTQGESDGDSYIVVVIHKVILMLTAMVIVGY